MDINQRNQILESFSLNNIRILFTLDSTNADQFQQADCIIYYDLPTNPISYLNRITQYSTDIKVINFINDHDLYTKRIIETICKCSMTQWPYSAVQYV